MINGKNIQSENNLILLKYLELHETVKSRKEWAQGALDWLEQKGQSSYFSNLLVATHSIDPRSVHFRRVGSSHEFEITDFGRRILAAQEPVWIRGKGWFAGFSEPLCLVLLKDETG